MPLYDRKVQLRIGPEGEQGRQWGDTLRVGWNVQHKRSGKPTTAKADLYNPDPDTQDYIRSGKKTMQIKVGYRTPLQIFVGYIKDGGVSLHYEGGDERMEIEASDKAFEGQKKFIDEKIPSGSDIQSAVQHIAASARIPIESLDFGTNPPKLKQTMVLSETAQNAFQKLADRSGVDIWTKDGKLVAAQQGKSPRSRTVVQFSQEAGTLLSVEPKKKGRIKVNVLLKPQIRPGDLFSLEHERYSGGWRARDVTFRGDSGYENTYQANITAEPR